MGTRVENQNLVFRLMNEATLLQGVESLKRQEPRGTHAPCMAVLQRPQWCAGRPTCGASCNRASRAASAPLAPKMRMGDLPPPRGPARPPHGRPMVRTSQQPASAGEARSARLAAGPAPPRRPPRPRRFIPPGPRDGATGVYTARRAPPPPRAAGAHPRACRHCRRRAPPWRPPSTKYQKKVHAMVTPLRRDMTAQTHRWSPRIPRWPAVTRTPLRPRFCRRKPPLSKKK